MSLILAKEILTLNFFLKKVTDSVTLNKTQTLLDESLSFIYPQTESSIFFE